MCLNSCILYHDILTVYIVTQFVLAYLDPHLIQRALGHVLY
jgi:hypothetical protein